MKLAILLLLAALSTSASGYNYLSCSLGREVNFGGGHMEFNFANNLSTAQKESISEGFSRLTRFSNTSITVDDNNDSRFSFGNLQNEIYLDNGVETAHCIYFIDPVVTCRVLEADIAFGNLTWTTEANSQHAPYDVSQRLMTGTAVHEGGHCLGMAHNNTIYNMMGNSPSHVTRNSLTSYYGPGEDLSNGLIDLHGKRSPTDRFRDVGITVMRYLGVSGEYSTHKFGVLKDAAATRTLPVFGSYQGQPSYRLRAGDSINMELTVESNGEKDSEHPEVGYYLSTNDTISSLDTLLTTSTHNLVRNTPYQMTQPVTIPANTQAGYYFLGAFIDDITVIPEVTGKNNQAWYPVYVTIPIGEAVDRNDLSWAQEGDWYGLESATAEDNDAATSAPIEKNEISYIETTVVGPGRLSFDWAMTIVAGSDDSNDGLSLHMDGLPVIGMLITGASPWRHRSISIAAGSHSMKWQLSKFTDDPAGSEAGWVDNVQFVSPDLIVESPAVSDTPLSTGESFRVTATVKNSGDGSAASSTLRYYYSTDKIISTADTPMTLDGRVAATTAVNALAVNEKSQLGALVYAPNSNGTWWIGTCVDSVLDEANTANNCSAGVKIVVETPPPLAADLIVSGFSLGGVSSATPGQGIVATGNVINQGNTAAAATTLRYFHRQKDGVISASDTEFDQAAVNSLAAGATAPQFRIILAPATPGIYWIGTCADSVSGESNIQNNCSAGVQITVAEPQVSDLIIDSVSLSGTDNLVPGLGFLASASVNNQGNASAAATSLRYYLRATDALISPSDIEIGVNSVGTLAAAETTAKIRILIAPEISDTYWVGVCVDEVAGESNTSNNCSMGIQIEVLPAPDGCVFSTSGNVDAVIDNHVFSSDNRCTASNSISAPHATGSLGPVEIPSGVAIKLEAETITLYPGFSVQSGGSLCVAQVGNCP